MRIDRAYYDKWSPSFPIDKNVEEFKSCNLSNWYEFKKPVGTFEVGQTEGKSLFGVSWGYGYEATTYGDLAETLGVSVMTLHYHLSDKMEELESATEGMSFYKVGKALGDPNRVKKK